MANKEYITAAHLNQRDFQFQHKNHFEVQFALDEVLANTGLTWDSNTSLLVKSFPLPKKSTEVVRTAYFNQEVKSAGKTTYDGGNLTIHDALGYDIEKVLSAWSNKVHNPKTGKSGYIADYKANGTVTEYGPNGENGRVWELIGCWPSSLDPGDLDYEDQTEKAITAQITYDWAYRSDLTSE